MRKIILGFMILTMGLMSCATAIPITSNLEDYNYEIERIPVGLRTSVQSIIDFTEPIEPRYPEGSGMAGGYLVSADRVLAQMLRSYATNRFQGAADSNYIKVIIKELDFYVEPVGGTGDVVLKAFIGGQVNYFTKAAMIVDVEISINGQSRQVTLTESHEEIHDHNMVSSLYGELAYNIASAGNRNVPIQNTQGINLNQVNNKIIRSIGRIVEDMFESNVISEGENL